IEMNSRDMNSRVTLHRLTISRCLSTPTPTSRCKQLLPESAVLSKRHPRPTSGVSEIHGNGHANIEELGMINTSY
ncbi:MAG TPA: hypothetical protein VFW91_16980, partial [Candidatus Binatia bacterium]|nr:hypothetical protein [Candidatus Binatia bacterium]